jgi:ABC-type Fe3+-hydroxamate transport system substrate-binding protein
MEKIITDQLGDKIKFNFPARRIISLVPSQTELLFDLGLDQEVTGITKFCIHPASWLKAKKIVGGTKNFGFDIIDELKPDLIIGNKEENYEDGIRKLKQQYPVWMSDITTLDDASSMIKSVGDITARAEAAQQILNKIDASFLGLKKHGTKSVLYLIWKKPWMAAGNNTFIHTLLEKIGLKNCVEERTRYPELSDAEIKALAPDLIFLSSEPFPFREQHISELQAVSPSSKVLLVDGEMFSWYGSRLIKAPEYFNGLNI